MHGTREQEGYEPLASDICVCGHTRGMHSLGGSCHECTCGYFYPEHREVQAVVLDGEPVQRVQEELCCMYCGHGPADHIAREGHPDVCDNVTTTQKVERCLNCNCKVWRAVPRAWYKAREQKKEAKRMVQEPSELHVALKNQLQGILSKPFNAKTLKELERTARLARELLIVAKGGGVPTRSLSTLGVSGEAYFGDDIDDELTPAVVPPAETFGAASIRELVSALRKQNAPSFVSLVHALKDAKDMGLEDVAKDLEAQIKRRQKDDWGEAAQSAADAAVAAVRDGDVG